MLRPSRFARFAPHALVAGVVMALAGLLVPAGRPCPRVDDAFYKSPAAELAQNGLMAIPCCAGFVPRAEQTFACYPPVYQLLLATWYRAFGFSLHSSLSFCFLVHLLGAVAVTELSVRFTRSAETRSTAEWVVPAAVAGLVYAGNLAYFDRQEETALLWLWLELLLLGGVPRGGIARSAISGLLVGLAGLTSPFVGAAGMIIVLARRLTVVLDDPGSRRISGLLPLGITAAFAAVPAVFWYFAMESMHPGIIEDQFLWLMAHLKRTQDLGTLSNRITLTVATLLHNPSQLPAAAILLCGFPLAVARRGWRRIDPRAIAVYVASVFGILLIVLLRPKAYTYMGAVLMLMPPCLALALHALATNRKPDTRSNFRLGWVVAACCLVLAFRQAAGLVVESLAGPESLRVDRVAARLRSIVPEGDMVAVTARHWHAFQGRNPWREAFFSSLDSPDPVIACRWLVLDPEVGRPWFIGAFDLVEEVPAARGSDVGQSYAYSVWRRKSERHEPHAAEPTVVSAFDARSDRDVSASRSQRE